MLEYFASKRMSFILHVILNQFGLGYYKEGNM